MRSELALAAAQRKYASVVGSWQGRGGPQRWKNSEVTSAKFSKVQQSSAKFGKVQQGSARFTRERDRKDEEIEEIEEIVILLSSCSNITRVVQQVSAERLSVELANPGSPDKSFQQKRLEAVNREFNKGSSHEFLCCNSPFAAFPWISTGLPSKLREVSIAATCPTRRMASPKQLTKPRHSRDSEGQQVSEIASRGRGSCQVGGGLSQCYKFSPVAKTLENGYTQNQQISTSDL